MRKLLLSFVSLFFICQSFAQLNQIDSLDWDHWYVYPTNLFSLQWSQPAASADTLIGYNIYRNDSLYRFQTETYLTNYYYPTNCLEDFVWFNGGSDFYIHVTAVYNNDSLESAYTDSAYCAGYAVGLNPVKEEVLSIYPNPVKDELIINVPDVHKVQIYNSAGQLIKEHKNSNTLNMSEYLAGLYFVRIYSRNGVITEPLLKE